MSYIHEALIKAQKERNGHYPKDTQKVAESIGMTVKSSWLTLLLFFMLISILVAIIVYSWFKTQQQKQIQTAQYASEISTDITIEKNKNIKDNVQKTTILSKVEIFAQEKLDEKTQADQKEKQLSDDDKQRDGTIAEVHPTTHDDEPNEQKIVKDSEPLGPDQFLEVTRLYKKGLQDQVKKKYDSAMAFYKECLKISPHMAPTLNNMGVILLKQKNYLDAQKYFLIAIEESPEYVDPYYNLACLFSQTRDSTQAIEYLKKAVRLSEEARHWAITDKDFEPLYELPEFNMIIAGYNL
ncbi:MAG: tetratricopeptide repeat protein [Candidatus Magnetomorum sp.]|nr:tetratricopeptide repeat protein [Candidatus Magnetomorum sp.]